MALALLAANTVYKRRGQLCDGVASTEALAAWLGKWIPRPVDEHSRDHGERVRQEVTAAELTAFHRLRDALRRGFNASARSREPAADVMSELNDAAARAPTWPSLHYGRAGLEVVHESSAAWPTVALAAIAGDGMVLLSGRHARPVRACASKDCVQFFLASDPRRRWCSPACGNRARVARHYDKHRQTRNAP